MRMLGLSAAVLGIAGLALAETAGARAVLFPAAAGEGCLPLSAMLEKTAVRGEKVAGKGGLWGGGEAMLTLSPSGSFTIFVPQGDYVCTVEAGRNWHWTPAGGEGESEIAKGKAVLTRGDGYWGLIRIEEVPVSNGHDWRTAAPAGRERNK